MSVWGIGASYNREIDKHSEFVNNGYAYIGWSEEEAPALYKMMSSIKVGDIIYIKAFYVPEKRLTVKALGIVTDNKMVTDARLGTGVKVKWLDDFEEQIITVTDEIYKNNVFNNTLYEEYNEDIINKLINQIIK